MRGHVGEPQSNGARHGYGYLTLPIVDVTIKRLILEEKLSPKVTDEVFTKFHATSSDLVYTRPPSPRGEGTA